MITVMGRKKSRNAVALCMLRSMVPDGFLESLNAKLIKFDKL